MKPLPTEFAGRADQNGPAGRYMFKQLKRVGDVAMYQKHNPKHPLGTAMSYEVVVVQKRPERTFPDGRVADAHEAMPIPEDWGIYGWSPFDLESALVKFDLIVASQTQIAIPAPTGT